MKLCTKWRFRNIIIENLDMCANISDTRAMSSMIAACKKCARSLSKKSYIQSMLVRYLIEASIDHVSLS